jgi:hypothetical protein
VLSCHLIVGRGHLGQPSLPLSFLCPFRPKVVSDAQHTNKPHQKHNKTKRLIERKTNGQ